MYQKYTNPKTDLIVLSPEYGMLDSSNLNNKICNIGFLTRSKTILFNNPNCFTIYISKALEDIVNMFKTYDANRKINKIYSRSAFNNYGDVVSHLKIENQKFDKLHANNFLKINSEELEAYSSFIKNEIIDKGYRVILIPTIIPQSSCKMDTNDKLSHLNNYLSSLTTVNKNLENYPKPVFCLADEMFFDTAYHLNRVGREIKTGIFAEYIKLALKYW